ncbi:hypothetical protein [Methanosalsum natronophilum]|uniref:Uncharacterized protein n=1 Tax=Methanosalsum natronophilum TaxID=768733 RepID=A0A3R7WA60_9EURY|nr:hypothetical protein [Methanosalsum natronophilum]MCS3924243.1 hypothetical protein [Methanosalsum natronophilum]RQD80025.1 MAG: hypothetical protein D5R95_09085 [Methanosalsum natronophilum]
MGDENKPPVFCENYCIICKGARSGNSIAKKLQEIELSILGEEGCPFGKARTKYYGVTPDQPVPPQNDN